MPDYPYVLMLEDDPDDRFITERTLAELGHRVAVRFVKSSHELFTQLEASTPPMLILLDRNSVALAAIEVLQRLKADVRYSRIPVIVLAESVPHNVNRYYELGASSFICKPSSAEATKEKIDLFFRYWLSVAELPVAMLASPV